MRFYTLKNGRLRRVRRDAWECWSRLAPLAVRQVDQTIVADGCVLTMFVGAGVDLWQTTVARVGDRTTPAYVVQRYEALGEAKAGHWRISDEVRRAGFDGFVKQREELES